MFRVSHKVWNQSKLGYFEFYFDRAYGEGGIVFVEKNIYNRNMLLFI